MDINTYENDEKELDAEFEPFEDDVELDQPRYEVWGFCYDENDNILDREIHFGTFDDPDPAVAKAKYLVDQPDALVLLTTDEVAYMSIEVETVIDLDGMSQNDATLFQEIVILRRK